MKFPILAIAAATAITATPVGAVTVIGATKIEITNAMPTWLQIAEVQAFNFSATNVALALNGGTVTDSSEYAPGFSAAARAIDGNIGGNYYTDGIFHSGTPNAGEYLNVSFAAANLQSLSIFGRSEAVNERDVYNVKIFNAGGETLYSGQLSAVGQTATVIFDAAPATFDAGAAVPEPASWALMIVGFGMAGAMLRRRRPGYIAMAA